MLPQWSISAIWNKFREVIWNALGLHWVVQPLNQQSKETTVHANKEMHFLHSAAPHTASTNSGKKGLFKRCWGQAASQISKPMLDCAAKVAFCSPLCSHRNKRRLLAFLPSPYNLKPWQAPENFLIPLTCSDDLWPFCDLCVRWI